MTFSTMVVIRQIVSSSGKTVKYLRAEMPPKIAT